MAKGWATLTGNSDDREVSLGESSSPLLIAIFFYWKSVTAFSNPSHMMGIYVIMTKKLNRHFSSAFMYRARESKLRGAISLVHDTDEQRPCT